MIIDANFILGFQWGVSVGAVVTFLASALVIWFFSRGKK